jgi:hypothetical protein
VYELKDGPDAIASGMMGLLQAATERPSHSLHSRNDAASVERAMELKTQRVAKKKTPKTPEDKLDDALEDTFPASDPPAQTEPITHLGAKHKPKKK